MTKYYEGDKLLYDDGIASPRWVYHPEHGAKMVDATEAEALLTQGWYDNPGFPGRDTDTTTGETPKPLGKMSKAELVAHAMSLGLELVPDDLTKAEMIARIEAAA